VFSHAGHPHKLLYLEAVINALREDLGGGDITTFLTVPAEKKGSACIVAKEDCIICGVEIAMEAFRQMNQGLSFYVHFPDGSFVSKGAQVLEIEGMLTSILQAERVALNFMQRMSAVATLTRRFANEIKGISCRIVDTRKTTPGLRHLEKYAVRVGGGFNHRFGLSDGILIKDNHIASCGSVREAIRNARLRAPHPLKIQIEVSDFEQLREALDEGADAVLLDNMDVTELSKAVMFARARRPEVLLEASGGVTLANVREIALSGVDIISSGALTHSAKAIDLSLRVKQ